MEEENKDEGLKISPAEYFETLKGAKQEITEEKLKNSYAVILQLAEKYKTTGQKRSLEKLKFLAGIIGDEEKLIPLGVTKFVYRDVIEDYINKIKDDAVKVIELSNYVREIPDELVEVVEKTKDIFTQFYVVFTDYTGKEERRIAYEKRDKDPILFGCFKNSSFVADRFYFLGDWVDEYCDLTLDKLVDEYREARDGKTPVHLVEFPQTSDELVNMLSAYTIDEKKEDGYVILSDASESILNLVDTTGKKKRSFFDKVRSIFSRNYKE